MRHFLLLALLFSALASHAQTLVPVPAKAVARLQNLLRQTQAEVEIGARSSSLPAETRPQLNKVLVKAAAEFLTLATHNPTREEYFKSLDAGLAQLTPLVVGVQDRQQLADYFQDVLDIVGLESSEGRLTAFVQGTTANRQ